MSLKISNILTKFCNFGFAIMLIAASCGLNFISMPAFAKVTSCTDVNFIFARGSGEALNGPSITAWRNEIVATFSENPGFTYKFYELGSQSQRGHKYSAVAVGDNFAGYTNLVGAVISGGTSFRFGESVKEGIQELLSYVGTVSTACPHTKFVLGGYSQGAMVMSASLPAIDANKVIYVSTFGDPKLYLPEGKATGFAGTPKIPDACRGINLSPYRLSVPDCYAYEGVLGSFRPYQPDSYNGKLGTWCNEKDIMCSSGASLSDHTSYVSSNLYRDAAAVIARKLSSTFTEYHADWAKIFRPAKHNVVFLFDTTGSMGGSIEQYRTEAKKLATRIKADGGSIALVEYRDLDDEFEPRVLCDFSCDLATFSRHIDNLQVNGGGDEPESVLSGLYYAMNKFDWQAGATKSIVVLTDAGYHSPDRDGTTFSRVVQRSLEIDPVNVYTVTPANISDKYSTLVDATSGQAFTFDDDISISSETIFERPVARLALSTYSGQVGDEFYFDASSSYSTDGSDLRFDWDLDGDGEFELSDVEATVRRTYDHETTHFIQVRVTDQHAKSSTMSASVTVGQLAARTTITNLEASPQSNSSFLVTFRTDGAKVLLSVDDAVLGFVELHDGVGQFTLRDVSATMSVTLTPYSAADERGISQTIQISPENTFAPTNPAGVFVPKAPDTGLVSRKYRD